MTTDSNILSLGPEREKLIRSGRLHWFHWLVVGSSLVLTIGAWYFSSSQVQEKVESRFKRESVQAVELIAARMVKYEDGLWGGVAAIQGQGGDISYPGWQKVAETLRIGEKYPGIHGIGLIHRVLPEQLSAYLKEQQKLRPDYAIHPSHGESEYLPITYIEPVATNAKAVGLDMAHETNRYSAAKKARETGTAQITGPITLVQDAQKTAGFLYYAPFYRDGTYATVEERRKHFTGLVYAPFVVKKLMAGTLAQDKRHVGIRIQDGSERVYDELTASEDDFDPKPMFQSTVDLDLYGRTWKFDIWSGKSFRAAAASNQPMSILVGGLLIDSMLFALFILLTKANRNALRYADSATHQLQLEKLRLERSNADLEQFAYVASHDLQEPLRMVGNFTQLLQKRYAGQLDEKADNYINYAVDGVKRMQILLNELLVYSRLGADRGPLSSIDSEKACEDAIDNLQQAIAESEVKVEFGLLPKVHADETQLTQLFQNLVSNAIKFRKSDRVGCIQISAEEQKDEWTFKIKDNGIGMDPEFHDKIFVMFQRLHDRQAYPGTGVGLATCKKIVIRHGGRIWVDSKSGEGSTFYFTLPKIQPDTNIVPIPPREVDGLSELSSEIGRRAADFKGVVA